MRDIDLFIQRQGFSDILVAAFPSHHTVAAVLATIEGTMPHADDVLLFIEDMPCPIQRDSVIEELLPLGHENDPVACPLRLHLSRCRHIDVSVRFNGEVVARRFTPGATIGRVQHWAARRAFGMTPRDAAEHVLQVQGSAVRPDRDVHVGTLTGGNACCVALDLLPRKRVEG